MMTKRSIFFMALAFVLVACSPAGPGPAVAATINRDCGPADGPAFTVSVPMQGRGIVNVSIWRAPEIQARTTFTLSQPTDATGSASLSAGSDMLEPLTGTITFERVAVDQPANGSFRLADAAGGSLVGTFSAEWQDLPAYCG